MPDAWELSNFGNTTNAATGDLDIRFSTPGGERNYHLTNVWAAGRMEKEINRLVASRDTV